MVGRVKERGAAQCTLHKRANGEIAALVGKLEAAVPIFQDALYLKIGRYVAREIFVEGVLFGFSRFHQIEQNAVAIGIAPEWIRRLALVAFVGNFLRPKWRTARIGKTDNF